MSGTFEANKLVSSVLLPDKPAYHANFPRPQMTPPCARIVSCLSAVGGNS